MIEAWQNRSLSAPVLALLCCLILCACGAGTTTTVPSRTGVAPSTHSVDLSWTPSASTVIGYFVYRSTNSGGPYSRISSLVNDTTATDTEVSAGETYYYVATAVAADGAESAYSNEISVVIPVP